MCFGKKVFISVHTPCGDKSLKRYIEDTLVIRIPKKNFEAASSMSKFNFPTKKLR